LLLLLLWLVVLVSTEAAASKTSESYAGASPDSTIDHAEDNKLVESRDASARARDPLPHLQQMQDLCQNFSAAFRRYMLHMHVASESS